MSLWGCAPASSGPRPWANDSIDALAAFEPTADPGPEKSPGSTDTVLSGHGNDSPLLLVASRAFADVHPDAIRAIVAGTHQAVDWINADPDAAGAATAVVTGAPATVEAAMFRKMDWKVRLDDQTIDRLK